MGITGNKLFLPWQKSERLHQVLLCTSLGTSPAECRTYQTDYAKYGTYIQPTVLMNVFCAGDYYENVNKNVYRADKLGE